MSDAFSWVILVERRVRLFINVAGIALLIAFIGITHPTTAHAQRSCPSGGGENPNPDSLYYIVETTNGCAQNVNGASAYDNFSNVPFFRFAIFLPDSNPRDGANYPALLRLTDGTNIKPISSITCAGGTIGGVGTNYATVALADGGSCALTVGADGDQMGYSGATLSRSGSVYTVTAGYLSGGVFGGTFPYVPNVAPRVVSVVRQTPATSPTNADSLTWRITFDEDVQNVDAADFTVTGTTATVTSVSTVTAGTVYDVTASGGDLANLNATVTLSFTNSQNIQDTSGSALTNTTPTTTNDNSFVVANIADMSLDLTGLPATATVGTPYTGHIKCTNSASATASALNATCSVSGLPAGLLLGACSPAPPTTVAAGASITCPVSGTPTSTASATVMIATGATNDNNAGNNTGTVTIAPAGTPGLSLNSAASPGTFSGIGQSIAFTYTVTNSGNVTVTGVSVTDSKVSRITCAATTLSAGAGTTCTGFYTTSAADVTAKSVVSVATAHANFGATPVASSTATTTVGIDVAAVRRATAAAIQGLMSRRADMITSTGPDTGRMHNRLTGSLFGGGAAPNAPAALAGLGGPRGEALAQISALAKTGTGDVRDALGRDRDPVVPGMLDTRGRGKPTSFGFSGTADDGGGRFAFSTSLAKIRAAAVAEQAQRERTALPAGLMGLGSNTVAPTSPPRFDVWTEGEFSYYSLDRPDGRHRGHAGMFFAGADYLVMPGLLVGALVQLDWMDETTSAIVRNADGHGWMAGPYVSTQLTPNLFFDARALWGRSNNHVNPLGAYTDSFETSRALAAAKLTGRWVYGALSFQPSAELIYFKEDQKAYTNAIDIDIASQSVHLGRLTFGPEVGYRLAVGDGGTFEPFVGLKGVWDFAKTDQTTAAGETVGQEAWRGRIEAGATLRTRSGIALRARGTYDGLGDSHFNAWQGRATLVVPLQ